MYFRMEGETEREGQAEGEKDAQRQRQRRKCNTLYFDGQAELKYNKNDL